MSELRLPTIHDVRDEPEQLVIELTSDWRYQSKAFAVPGAYYSKDRRAFVVKNPTPRAAAATIALFPEALVEHPELIEIRDSGYGGALRPYDYASELQIHLDVGDLGGKTLYPFQDVDLGYLAAIAKRDGGAFIGWSRGLGKSIATAALIKHYGARRSLVVGRNDAKETVWLPELQAALPDHEILVLPNEKKKRERALDYITTRDGSSRPLVLIIHYEAIALIGGTRVVRHNDGSESVTKGGGNGWQRLGRWDLMAFDEGHRLASYNPNSSRNTVMGRALSKLRRGYVDMAFNLTGTPIMNKPDDLFGQLHYLFPDIYRAKWADWNDPYVDFVEYDHRKVAIGFKTDKLEDLKRELGVFMVYRTKDEVLKDLPPLIRQDIELEMYPEQARVYRELRDQFWSLLDEGGVKAVNVLDQLNKLRRIATYYPGVPSVKLDFVMNELEEVPDEQFVVFTWYKDPGRRLAELLGDDAIVVDGDVPVRQRAELLRRHEDGRARVLIGSIATLGESLNLQYVHEAFRLDRHWNPAANDQTTDRLYRNGQVYPVTFRDLWTKGTIDTLRVRPNLASKESLRKAVFG